MTARKKSAPSRVARETLELLHSKADAKQAASYQRYFKEPVDYLGLDGKAAEQIKRDIIERVKDNSRRSPTARTFYFQSKQPESFAQFLSQFPDNVILLTTLETNRDKGYQTISKAPLPSVRYQQFKALDYPRKVVTIEPILDFDLRIFAAWIRNIHPEYVWIGFNSKPESVTLPEPSEDKVQKLIQRLEGWGIEVRGKTLRGVEMPG